MARIPWLERSTARLASRVIGDALLEVRGRRTGRIRTTLARPVFVGGRRYLVAIRGNTSWARNLRAARRATLRWRGTVEEIAAIEASGAERDDVVREFIATSGYAPTRRIMTEILPEPEQHPVFRIETVERIETTT